MKFKDNKTSDRAEVASMFADFFETVYATGDSGATGEIEKRMDVGNLLT